MAAHTHAPRNHEHWAVVWTASPHGPYPAGNATAQPDMSFAFPDPTRGASDQSFRMVVRPDAWGRAARIRLTNCFGLRPIEFRDAHIGLHLGSSAVFADTNCGVTFGGKPVLRLEPGQHAWSDTVELPFIREPDDPRLTGRKLAVSFHIAGESGPMTWHAKALQTSYLSPRGAASCAADESEAAFPYPTTSWYFLDALEMQMPAATKVVVCFGDSISDGTGSTMNGDDRWPDVLSRRLHAVHGNRIAVVNGGIGGNQILGPAHYDAREPAVGGPSALSRIERDVAGFAAVSTVIWLEGINDLGHGNRTAGEVIAGLEAGVRLMRRLIKGVRVIGATITPALNATTGAHGTAEVDAHRRTVNDFVRTSKLFDGVNDFDLATTDTANGELRAEMVPSSSVGGPGDRLHPNRIGYQAMGRAIDLASLIG